MTPGQRKAIKRKPLNKNDIPPLPNVGDNDILLECGFTQNQINAFTLQGTFFEVYTCEGEKYLVMPTNLLNDHPTIQEIFKLAQLQPKPHSETNYIQPPIKQFFKPSNVSIQQNKSPFPSQQSTSTSKTTSCSQKCARQSANSLKKTNSPTVEDLGADSDSNEHHVPRPELNNVFFPPKHIPSKCQMSETTLINTKDDNGRIFQPNQEILENGVVDFINYTVPDNEDSHDDFSKILSLQVPSKYQFEDDMSGEKDAVLDSADMCKTMASSYTNI